MSLSRQQEALEVTSALVLAALVVLAHGTQASGILALYLAAVSPALCRSDLTERRLPNRMVLPAYFVAGSMLVVGWLGGQPVPATSVVSALCYFGFLAALAALGGMGMGDVKLAGVLGFAAGALGPGIAILSPVIAFAVGALAALVTVARRRGRSIPFGPCMLAGFWSAALFF